MGNDKLEGSYPEQVEKILNMDEVFLNRVKNIIETHIQDQEFNVDLLGKEVGKSRSQLHKKLVSLTGLSASRFIRSYKLQRAKELLQMNVGNISEIYLMVGFSSLAYFGQVYTEQFGYPPSKEKKAEQIKQNNLARKRHLKSAFVIAVLTIMVLSLAWWYWKANYISPNTYAETFVDSRIAIIPFENKTNDQQYEVVGDMAADWIIEGLMNFENIKLVSYRNVIDYINYSSVGDWKSFSKQTGAEKIIMGSIYEQGDQLIIKSQVLDVNSGEIELVLPEVKGSKSNIEKIVVELNQRIKGFILVSIERSFIHKDNESKPPRYDAYSVFKKSFDHFGVDYDECRKYYNEAIGLDSSFYWPYHYCAVSYTNQGKFKQADSIFTLINLRFKKLSSYQQLFYNYLKENMYGDLPSELATLKVIYTKDPKDKIFNYLMGYSLLENNKPEEAIKVFEMIEPAKQFNDRRSTWPTLYYASALIRVNELEKALGVLDQIPDEALHQGVFIRKSLIYILQGRDEKVDELHNELESSTTHLNLMSLIASYNALYYGALGNRDKQLHWAKWALDRLNSQSQISQVSPIGRAYVNYLFEQYEQALPIYRDLIKQDDDWPYYSRIGVIHAKMNNLDSAEIIIQHLKQNDKPLEKGGYKYGLARIYCALNEKGLAIKYLQQAFIEGHGFNDERYNYDHEFVSLHGIPEYEAFVSPK